MKKIKITALIMLCILCLTGCWDKVEIEQRAFVLVIGVDKAKGTGEKEGSENPDKYKFSFVNPDTTKAQEGKVNQFITFEVEAPSYNVSIGRLLRRFAQYHTYEHTKALIFGMELMKEEQLFKSVLDAFGRGHQFNSSMYVFTTHGEAADIFKARPKMQSLLAYYITGISDNEKYTSRVGKRTFIDFMKMLYDNDGDAVIPSLDLHEDGVISSYIAIIKDYKYLDHLNEEDTKAWKWMNGKAKGGTIPVLDEEISVPFTYFNFVRNIYLDKIEDGKIYLTYDMSAEGSIEEYSMGKKLMDDKKLEELETKIEETVKKASMDLIKKMQDDYKVDLLGVREYLFKYHPKVYESIKDDFDQYFHSDIVINVDVDISIRRIGTKE